MWGALGRSGRERADRARNVARSVPKVAVPWARPGSRFTKLFEDTAAWLAARTDKTTITTLMRIAWWTVGSLIERVTMDGAAKRDRLPGLRRIGSDEISYRKGTSTSWWLSTLTRKNPENLTDKQRAKLSSIQAMNKPL